MRTRMCKRRCHHATEATSLQRICLPMLCLPLFCHYTKHSRKLKALAADALGAKRQYTAGSKHTVGIFCRCSCQQIDNLRGCSCLWCKRTAAASTIALLIAGTLYVVLTSCVKHTMHTGVQCPFGLAEAALHGVHAPVYAHIRFLLHLLSVVSYSSWSPHQARSRNHEENTSFTTLIYTTA
jgi:hypothetical protein